jgi:hypothetical protein
VSEKKWEGVEKIDNNCFPIISSKALPPSVNDQFLMSYFMTN